MKAANDSTLRVIADGLIHKAECRPKGSRSAQQLRDAAASILDADASIEREDVDFIPANDARPKGDVA